MNHKLLKLSLIIIFATAWSVGCSQDAHYWTEQFGNKSMLLGGTANACVEDLGLVFYNPGRLAQIENPAFVISAKIYELTKIRIIDGLGEGNDLKKSNFAGAPNMVAGTFKLPFLKNQNFAYSFLTRYRTQNNFDVKAIDSLDEQYADLNARINSFSSFREEWYGLTWSRTLNKHFSIGVTTFGVYTQSSGNISLSLQGLDYNALVDMLNFVRRQEFQAYGLLWKIGLVSMMNKMNVGLTITTPRIHLGGKGSTGFEEYISGVDSIGGNPFGDVYIENQQQNLDVNYRSPLSVALGVGIKFPKSIVHINSEWFSQIKKYQILQANEFVGQQPADTINFNLVDELQSVVNFGVGYEHTFRDKIKMYLSVSTDFSAINIDDGSFLYEFDEQTINNSSFDGDIVHFGGGLSLNMKWAELTFGTRYGSSERTIKRPLNLGEGSFFDPDATSLMKYSRWSFILGFSFPFANQVGEKLGFD